MVTWFVCACRALDENLLKNKLIAVKRMRHLCTCSLYSVSHTKGGSPWQELLSTRLSLLS